MVKVVLLRGDGIGPEIMDATQELVAATGAQIEWDEQLAGATAVKSAGAPLPPATLEAIRKHKIALKGPMATPIGGGYKSVNVTIRQELDLFANVRPARSFAGVKGRYEDCDLVVVRENTQELYSGIEFYLDPRRQAAQAISYVTRHACERVIRFAFEFARANKRKHVTLVHKANILKLTTGLFLETGKEVAAAYPEIQCDDRIVDNMAMQLVMRPQQFDVICTTNLFGDILSDLTAGLVGGLGLVPSGNYGDGIAAFEAVHGTAPDIAGKGVANPTALALSAAMMLRHIGSGAEATRLEDAIRETIAAGRDLTPDLGGRGSTKTFTKAIKDRLG